MTAVVAAEVGIAPASGDDASTVRVVVTRERVGDTEVVTVVPQP